MPSFFEFAYVRVAFMIVAVVGSYIVFELDLSAVEMMIALGVLWVTLTFTFERLES